MSSEPVSVSVFHLRLVIVHDDRSRKLTTAWWEISVQLCRWMVRNAGVDIQSKKADGEHDVTSVR
jgi:hypothetical protein